MRIKTLTAPTMPEALRLLREQLGPEALILGTRKVPGADGKPTLEITAAIEETESPSRPVAEPTPSQTPAQTASLQAQKPTTKPKGTLEDIFRQHGLGDDLSPRILAALPGLKEAGFNPAEAVEMLLGRLLTFTAPADLLAPGFVHVLVGPHGAGKTTLAGKLALHARKQGRTVGLMSLDDQKIAGVEPLAVVAETIGDTAHLVTDTASLRAAAAAMGQRQLIVVDTPGLNPYQPQAVGKLHQKIMGLGLPTQVHVVVPATLNADDMALLPVAAHRFQPVSLAVTRLDATSRFGAMLATAAGANLPLGLASHSESMATPPLALTARWVAEALTQYPVQPWEFPA